MGRRVGPLRGLGGANSRRSAGGNAAAVCPSPKPGCSGLLIMRQDRPRRVWPSQSLELLLDDGLKGRTALVTGADSGMGLAVARMLLDEGARVVVNNKAEDSIAKAPYEMTARGDVHAVAADLTQHASVERLGQADILVHAAGIIGDTSRIDGASVAAV